LAWAKGYTRDGWYYTIDFSKKDGKFRVHFADWRKEVWLLEELVVQPHNSLYRVYIRGAPTDIVGDLKSVVQTVANQIAYELETRGAANVIRGTKKEIPKPISVTPWGAARLVLGRAVPSAGAVAEVLRERREEEIGAPAPPTPPPTPAPAPAPPTPPIPEKKYAVGLGSEGLRRLRRLFEFTVRTTMGIEPTRKMKILVEEFLYGLDGKYKFAPRDEAIENATLELLRWIRDEFYFNPEF